MLIDTRLHPVSMRVLSGIVRLLVFVIPSLLLAVATIRAEGQIVVWMGIGTVLELAVLGVLMAYHRTWSPATDATVLFCYLLGLAWLLFALLFAGQADWFVRMALAIFALVPLCMVSAYTLLQSGALEIRRANRLARLLANRKDWPADLNDCRRLPEVKAFREALIFDATPALELLKDSRPEVRMAALEALEFRQSWRPGQAETVLSLLQREELPEVRAAVVSALGNIDDRWIVETVTSALRDPEPLVRKATAHALFWNSERRWSWIRFGVRRALREPLLRDDGPLISEGLKLQPEAVDDLIAWSAEKGIIGLRSVQTVMVHYAKAIQESPEETATALRRMVHDAHAPAILRIEAARLLKENEALDKSSLEKLLDPSNPAPLRLMAAESLLNAGPHDGAVASLRDIAHLPNRDLALSTASIVQRRLGFDLGLGLNQPLPPLDSPKAIEVTRRLMAWARQPKQPETAEEHFAAAFRRN